MTGNGKWLYMILELEEVKILYDLLISQMGKEAQEGQIRHLKTWKRQCFMVGFEDFDSMKIKEQSESFLTCNMRCFGSKVAVKHRI